MNDRELFKLYEKLYFHELKVSESLNARMQIPLAILVSLITAWLYIVQHVRITCPSLVEAAFIITMAVSFMFLVAATVFFAKAMHNNNTHYIPPAQSTQDYKLEVEALYGGFPNRDELVRHVLADYIRIRFIEASTRNMQQNIKITGYVFKTSRCIIVTACFTALSYALSLTKNLEYDIIQQCLSKMLE